jgi:ABC-type transport system involved in multi-copper enzyme maturation permease subunit
VNAAWNIAYNTFRENIRNRIMMVILLFSGALITVSGIVSQWSLNEQAKIVKDFGLAAISVFGLLIAMFVGVRTFYQEIERKTVYMLVSKPVARSQIILGKYAGLAGTVLVNLVILTFCLLGIDYLIEGKLAWEIMPAVALIILEIFLVIAWAVFFSMLTSSVLSSILTFLVYVTGHMAPDIMLYTKLHPEAKINSLLKFLYTIIPNLENFNIKSAVVGHLPLPDNAILYAVLYGTAYTAIVLVLTIMIFSRKDLK